MLHTTRVGTKPEMEQLELWYMGEAESSSDSEETCSLIDSGEWRQFMQEDFGNLLQHDKKLAVPSGKTKKRRRKKAIDDVVYEAVDALLQIQQHLKVQQSNEVVHALTEPVV